MNPIIDNLNVKIFADGADLKIIEERASLPFIKGLTTNPTLMRKSGVKDYKDFCLKVLEVINNKPISFEVFSDNFDEMKKQATEINSWGKNIYIKIPITNSKGISSKSLIRELSNEGVSLNVTAVFSKEQILNTLECLDPNVPSYLSIFAGRIADTGINPIPIMEYALEKIKNLNINCELIWASPREPLNIIQANEIGCNIITVTDDILKKVENFGYDLEKFSLDTVKMFYDDALLAGYKINTSTNI